MLRGFFLLLLALAASPGLRAASVEAEKAAEAERLRKDAGGLARRDGERLQLERQPGQAATVLTDLTVCERFENCLHHFWSGLRGDGRFHEVRVDFYEGGRWLWVDRRSGAQTEMQGAGQVAPQGRFVIAVNEAEGHERSGLWAWTITEGGLAMRFAFEDAPFRFVAWEQANLARVLRLSYDQKRCPGRHLGQAYRLRLDAQTGGRLERLTQAARCV